MDNPFIFGLLFFFILLFLTLKSAFNSINELQLELDKKKTNYYSKILTFISTRTSDFSITINIYFFFTLTLSVYILIKHLPPQFQSPDHLIFFVIFSIIIGIIIFPLIQILTQTIGEYFANEIINLLAFFLITIYILILPVTKIVLLITSTPFRIIYKNDIRTTQKIYFDKEDLNRFLTENQNHSSKNEETDAEIKLFKNALEFADIKIRECMIPRTEIIAVEISDLEKELKEKFIQTGYSRILIFKDTIENITGFIKSKSLFKLDVDLRDEIRDIPFFPETFPANKLLRFFIQTGQNLAVVVDEFGGVSGIVTIEDILEEIFGEITDEHDSVNLFEKKLSEQDFIFSGRLETDYLNEKYDLNIPENDDYETIAGFILYHTENFPKINDQITIENFKFTILKVSETRVELVKLVITSTQT